MKSVKSESAREFVTAVEQFAEMLLTITMETFAI